jgi:hypothetical protein
VWNTSVGERFFTFFFTFFEILKVLKTGNSVFFTSRVTAVHAYIHAYILRVYTCTMCTRVHNT